MLSLKLKNILKIKKHLKNVQIWENLMKIMINLKFLK